MWAGKLGGRGAGSSVPTGRPAIFWFPRHFVPGFYLHWVPPAFVQPFHEKLRRRVDYGGQAGAIFGNKINPQII
jgi:hypothetical protein